MLAWVERFQADLWFRQTGLPFTGRHGKFIVRAVWTDVDQLDVEVGKGAKMTFKTKKAPKELGWVWQFTLITPARRAKRSRSKVSGRQPERGAIQRTTPVARPRKKVTTAMAIQRS